MSKKQTYLTNAFYYISVPAAKNLLTFITLPIMTRFLSPSDYGTVSIITMLVSFSSIFFFGLNSASYRFYFKYRDDPDSLKAMLSTNMIFIILSSFAYGIGLLLFFPFINQFFFSGKLIVLWVVIAFFQYLLINVNLINQMLFQGGHQGKRWVKNEVIATLIQVPLAIGLVVFKIFTFEALIVSTFVAEAVKCIIIYRHMWGKYYAFKFKPSFFKESMAYSWPTTPTTIISLTYSYLDRILLSKYYGLFQVGLLEMSNKLPIILKMTMDGVDGVLSPINLELITENTKQSLERMARINLKIVFALLCVALMLICAIKEIVLLLTTKQFYPIMYIAPVYIYNHVFGILSMPTFWLIYHRTDKTYYKILMNVLFLACSISINLLLIPRYGMYGAAVAIFMSSAIVQVTQFFIGLRITPIPLDKMKIFMMLTALIVMTVMVYGLYYIDAPIIIDILVKGAMVIAFILFGLAINIVSVDDYSSLFSMMKDRLVRAKHG